MISVSRHKSETESSLPACIHQAPNGEQQFFKPWKREKKINKETALSYQNSNICFKTPFSQLLQLSTSETIVSPFYCAGALVSHNSGNSEQNRLSSFPCPAPQHYYSACPNVDRRHSVLLLLPPDKACLSKRAQGGRSGRSSWLCFPVDHLWESTEEGTLGYCRMICQNSL